MGLYQDILEYLEECDFAFVRRFIPYFLCSFGCHIFNVQNRKIDEDGETPLAFYWERRGIPDMRLPILMMAPPGYSKSTFLIALLDEFNGIFGTVIETFFKSYVTAAHLSGSVSLEKKDVVEMRGFLEEHPNYIVGVEEFNKQMWHRGKITALSWGDYFLIG